MKLSEWDQSEQKSIKPNPVIAAQPMSTAAAAILNKLGHGIKQQFEPLKDQLKSDEIKAILASKDCPKARTFGEMIPLAYTISKKNI